MGCAACVHWLLKMAVHARMHHAPARAPLKAAGGVIPLFLAGRVCMYRLGDVSSLCWRACMHFAGRAYIVDLAFKEQFIIAKPTERYAVLLDCLPHILVTEVCVGCGRACRGGRARAL